MKKLLVLLFTMFLFGCMSNTEANVSKNMEPTAEQMKRINECITAASSGNPSFRTDIIRACRNVVFGINN